MKVVILAGGFGSRLSEYTETVPKPMVKVGEHPILYHIMNIYSYFNYKDFYIALGYKGDQIKNYFVNYNNISSDISVDLKNGKITKLKKSSKDWKINLINTGLNSMTGGRIRKLRKFIGNNRFFLTYGDGLSDINLNDLLKFHKKSKKMVTVTAVRPSARFGELSIKNNLVSSFKEKPQINQGWINGGFFVIEPEFFELIDNDYTDLEKEPLEYVAKNNNMAAFQHNGFWQCMDTKRDLDLLQNLYDNDSAPWIK